MSLTRGVTTVSRLSRARRSAFDATLSMTVIGRRWLTPERLSTRLSSRAMNAIRENVEQIAFIAREDKRVDKRSGVSQRLPITVMESLISNAERRALLNRESLVTPRVSDIYSAIPAITGKIELEYEGEQIGAERVARDLIRKACAEVFGSRFTGIDFRQTLDHFNYGNTLTISDMTSDKEALKEFQSVSGMVEAVRGGKVEKET